MEGLVDTTESWKLGGRCIVIDYDMDQSFVKTELASTDHPYVKGHKLLKESSAMQALCLRVTSSFRINIYQTLARQVPHTCIFRALTKSNLC